MSIEKPILLPHHHHLLMKPEKQMHPLLKNKTIRLVLYVVSGPCFFRVAFQRQHPGLSQVCDDQTHYQITIRLGHSRLPGLVTEKLIHFDVI